jgi:hypothetical protein
MIRPTTIRTLDPFAPLREIDEERFVAALAVAALHQRLPFASTTFDGFKPPDAPTSAWLFVQLCARLAEFSWSFHDGLKQYVVKYVGSELVDCQAYEIHLSASLRHGGDWPHFASFFFAEEWAGVWSRADEKTRGACVEAALSLLQQREVQQQIDRVFRAHSDRRRFRTLPAEKEIFHALNDRRRFRTLTADEVRETSRFTRPLVSV